MNIVTLESKQKSALVSGLRKLIKEYEPLSFEGSATNRKLLEIASDSKHCFYDVLGEVINDKARKTQSLLCIKNLPVSNQDPRINDCIAIGMAASIGHPFQYSEQNHGRINARIQPLSKFVGKENTGEGTGNFDWHTDDAYFDYEYRTKMIQLYCQLNEAKAFTKFAMLDEIVKYLSKDEIALLERHDYKFRLPYSFGQGAAVYSEPKPVLFVGEEGLEINYSDYGCVVDQANTIGFNLLKKISQIADNVQTQLLLEPGDLVLFNNNKLLHGRSPFNSRKPRFLIRTYIRPDLNALNKARYSKNNTYGVQDLM